MKQNLMARPPLFGVALCAFAAMGAERSWAEKLCYELCDEYGNHCKTVCVEIGEPGRTLNYSCVKVASGESAARAANLAAALEKDGLSVFLQKSPSGESFDVKAGPFLSEEAALRAASRLQARDFVTGARAETCAAR